MDFFEKLKPNTVDKLVHVMYIQWTFMLTQMMILQVPGDIIGNTGAFLLPFIAGSASALMLFRNSFKRQRKNENDDEASENIVATIQDDLCSKFVSE